MTGPYEIVGGDGPTYHEVRLLGDDVTATVHWKKLCRLAGDEYEPTEEVVASALHDRQRFVVDGFDSWSQDGNDVEMLVRWRHHSDDERTWKPLEKLLEARRAGHGT